MPGMAELTRLWECVTVSGQLRNYTLVPPGCRRPPRTDGRGSRRSQSILRMAMSTPADQGLNAPSIGFSLALVLLGLHLMESVTTDDR